jgi:hypothetical protein
MEGLIVLGLIIAVLATLDLAASRLGVDSRPGFNDGRAPTDVLSL